MFHTIVVSRRTVSDGLTQPFCWHFGALLNICSTFKKLEVRKPIFLDLEVANIIICDPGFSKSWILELCRRKDMVNMELIVEIDEREQQGQQGKR